jgi:hypothetical protein
MTARAQLQKNLWSWAWMGLAPRWTEWRETASLKVTLTLALKLVSCRLELVVAMMNCEAEASLLVHEYRNWRISIVGNCYQATTNEDIEAFMCAAVKWFVECVDPWHGYSYV